MHLMNASGNMKIQMRDPKELFKFKDELPPPLDPEEQEQLKGEHLQFHKSKFWMKLKTDSEGNIKTLDQEDFDRLMKRNNN